MSRGDGIPVRQARRHSGLPSMTGKMQRILSALREAHELGAPWQRVAGMHGRTRRSLLERDWIVNDGAKGTLCRVTGRGRKALAAYEARCAYRYDGICPACGERPKHVAPSGRRHGYCLECKREHQLKQYRLKGHQLDPNGVCASCKQAPRCRWPSGEMSVYCADCLKARRRVERRAKHDRLLARIAAGEGIPCIRCKRAPRYIAGRTVFDYCHACYREQQNTARRRKEYARVLENARGKEA